MAEILLIIFGLSLAINLCILWIVNRNKEEKTAALSPILTHEQLTRYHLAVIHDYNTQKSLVFIEPDSKDKSRQRRL